MCLVLFTIAVTGWVIIAIYIVGLGNSTIVIHYCDSRYRDGDYCSTTVIVVDMIFE